MSEEQEPEAVAAEEAPSAAAPASQAAQPEELSGDAPAAADIASGGRIDLDLLMDVQVSLTVEIGRARLPIKDLLALNAGSIVTLDREVNEPIDLLINGTLIARGEVVESEGSFGLRLLDVVSPGERLQKLKR